jgi:hypothetical protein
MISLPDERVGPYLRALRAGLSALAPNTDHPDPLALDTHLQALDPSLSTTLLLPARLDPGSGLPDATWMDRARAEVAAAQHVRPTEPARIDAIRAADPELAERLTGRSKLLAWLATRPLAPDMWVEARLVRRGEGRAAAGRRVRVTLDRRVPRVGWVRLRVDVDDPAARGAVVRAYTRQDGVDLEPGFAELLARHVVSPLAGLHEIIRSATDLRIHRLSRGILGPFWFPGGPEVAEAPAWVCTRVSRSSARKSVHARITTPSPSLCSRRIPTWGPSAVATSRCPPIASTPLAPGFGSASGSRMWWASPPEATPERPTHRRRLCGGHAPESAPARAAGPGASCGGRARCVPLG